MAKLGRTFFSRCFPNPKMDGVGWIFFLLFNTLLLSFCRLSQGVRVKPIMAMPRFRKRLLHKVLHCWSKQLKWKTGDIGGLRAAQILLWRDLDRAHAKYYEGLSSINTMKVFKIFKSKLNPTCLIVRRWRNIFWNASRSSALSLLASRWVVTSLPLLKLSHTPRSLLSLNSKLKFSKTV